jgi:hypothetical protein
VTACGLTAPVVTHPTSLVDRSRRRPLTGYPPPTAPLAGTVAAGAVGPQGEHRPRRLEPRAQQQYAGEPVERPWAPTGWGEGR